MIEKYEVLDKGGNIEYQKYCRDYPHNFKTLVWRLKLIPTVD